MNGSPRTRHDFAYPWPWQIKDLVEEHAVDRDVDLRDLAADWGCTTRCLKRWVRSHGFRVEAHRATRRGNADPEDTPA